MPVRVLVAFDKFKGSLSAEEACAVVGREIARLHPNWETVRAPLSDGGDGFTRILTVAARGLTTAIEVRGPLGEIRVGEFGRVELKHVPRAARQRLGIEAEREDGVIGIVDTATASGLALVPEHARDPWRTTTLGTGQLLAAAAGAGVDAIVLGVGGSATSDLGLGALAALGFRFWRDDGMEVHPPFPWRWEEIERIEPPRTMGTPPIAIACDVDNPLLGPRGAAAVFGPQKGLRAVDLPRHERLAERLGRLLCAGRDVDFDDAAGRAGAGAAGGITFGLTVALGARIVSGFSLVSDWLDLPALLERADVVVTGEGRFDASSLAGKATGSLVREALARGRRVVVLAGSVEENAAPPGAEVFAISPAGQPVAEASREAAAHLARAVARHLG